MSTKTELPCLCGSMAHMAHRDCERCEACEGLRLLDITREEWARLQGLGAIIVRLGDGVDEQCRRADRAVAELREEKRLNWEAQGCADMDLRKADAEIAALRSQLEEAQVDAIADLAGARQDHMVARADIKTITEECQRLELDNDALRLKLKEAGA